MGYLTEFKKNKKFNGHGLIGHYCLEKTQGSMITQAFDSVISELNLSNEDAFLFANSAYGRYLGDLLDNTTSFSKIKSLIREHVKMSLSLLYSEKKRWN